MHTAHLMLAVLVVWVALALPVALFVGAAIRLGQHPLAERLGEVEADRLADEAHDPLFV